MNSLLKSIELKKIISKSPLVLFFILGISYANAQQANYAGNWKVNRDKSDFGKYGEPGSAIGVKILQTADSLIIERNSQGHAGENHSYTERLSFDGKVVETMIRPTVKKKASIKLDNTTRSLAETAAYKDYQAVVEYTATETWALSNGGKTLTIDRVEDGDEGRSASKLVYDKQ